MSDRLVRESGSRCLQNFSVTEPAQNGVCVRLPSWRYVQLDVVYWSSRLCSPLLCQRLGVVHLSGQRGLEGALEGSLLFWIGEGRLRG
jgi:hypothetical protein